MAKGYTVKPCTHPRYSFVVRGRENGKSIKRYFVKRAEAQTYAQIKNTELKNHGREGASFPAKLRVMAQEAQARLAPYGKTIEDAVRYYVGHLQATVASVPIEQAVKELISNRASAGSSKQYCEDLRWRLGRFSKSFPGRCVAEITTRDIDDWLAGLGLGAVTRNTFRRDLRTFFSFSLTRKYCSENPAKDSTRAKEVDGEVACAPASSSTH
jgi:site-specific recombinase XerD